MLVGKLFIIIKLGCAMLTRPLQHLVVAILFRPSAGLLASRAVVRARPLQHLEVAALRRVRARPFVPEETGRSQRLQLLELSAVATAAQTSARSTPTRRPRKCLSFSKLAYPRYAAPRFDSFFYLAPVASMASRMRVLTAPSRPRSAGSGSRSELRMCVEIPSRGRLEMTFRAVAVSTRVG